MAVPAAKKYIADFEKMGFGMFIHWGLYSQLGKGEWILHHKIMPEVEYQKLKDTFTAEDFDAEKIVLMAKNAGCKYIVLTSRHHEGFSLYDTCGLSDYDAMHSAAGRDLIREFVDACNKHDIAPFFYHTTLDWHHPDFESDFNKYLDYLIASVKLLCTNYGKIGGIWFDGNWSNLGADWREDELYGMIRKYQPEAIIVNNSGLDALGAVGHPELDVTTFEQNDPRPLNREGMPKYLAVEKCETINDHWGIGELDLNSKSPKALIEALCNCRKVGANYLLNIGPTAQGGVDPYQEQVFAVIGKWVKLFGEAIYDVKPYGSYGMGKNFILKGKDCLYLFFFNITSNGDSHVKNSEGYHGAYAFGDVADKIQEIFWLDNQEQLSFCQQGDMLTVNATGYPYGISACVRVAKAMLK